MVLVKVEGVGVLPHDGTPVIVLREAAGHRRWMIITVGRPEARALVAAQEHISHDRADTLELLVALVDVFGRNVERVEIVALRDDQFYAEVVFDAGVRVSARPSDAVAIALLVEVPVLVADTVLQEAGRAHGVVADDEDGAAENDQVTEFREFLDVVSPEDFDDLPPG
jgi:bifunctional DNase/RNase